MDAQSDTNFMEAYPVNEAKEVDQTTYGKLLQLTFRQNTEQELRRAKAEVERLKEILSILDRNPDTERLLTLMGNRLKNY